jgi:hypothetical protein
MAEFAASDAESKMVFRRMGRVWSAKDGPHRRPKVGETSNEASSRHGA